MIRKVKLSVCLLEICWLCSPHNNNNKHLFVIVMVWATQAEIPSKQMLSLTFLMSKDIEKMKSVILLIDIALRK